MKRLLVAASLLFLPASAWAVCPNPLTVKDAAGATQNISTTNDGSGNCQSAIVINVGGALDGWNVTEGTKSDSAATSGTGGTWTIAALLRGQLNAMQSAIPAGTSVIGKVGIDQTTPGTTNLVALAANQSVNVAQIGGTNTVNGGVAGTQGIGGTVATNVAITANPLNLGAQAVSSENTAVTTARQVQLVADLVGKLIVLPYSNPENIVSGVISSAMTGTTSTSLIAAPAAGLRNYVTSCVVSNSHATVGTDILLQDGSGGTTLAVFPAAPAYGGAAITFPSPIRQPTTATAIFAQNVTTGSNTKISCFGYKGA